MNKSPSPYFVQTVSGKLQLTKGLYLALQRKKASALKTAKKKKTISHADDKKTVSKAMRSSITRKMVQSLGGQKVAFKNSKNNSMIFSVGRDSEFLNTFIDIPTIQMVDDNDEETSWNQVQEGIRNMSLSLSISAFDRAYGRI